MSVLMFFKPSHDHMVGHEIAQGLKNLNERNVSKFFENQAWWPVVICK